MLDISGQRSAALKLSRTCPVVLGGKEYVLRVLTIAANERWNAQLNADTAALVNALTVKGVTLHDIFTALSEQTDQLVELLVSYDQAGDKVLPTADEIKEMAYADELVTAVQGVWRAANPLVVIGLAAVADRGRQSTPTPPSSEPTSTPPTPTASGRKKSATN